MSKPRLCEGGCGRLLTDPVSIARRYGKRCAERLGITAVSSGARRPRPVPRPDTPPEVHPDQTALELRPMQPSLWSL
ncbi:DUF6011 domain-containing protein [Streptomyces viridosporus]|uniref:DUF6011 domain-containing protein n=1 Tax=Streptomyces viridosporus TaxID=67581 RepID=UPI0026C4DF31